MNTNLETSSCHANENEEFIEPCFIDRSHWIKSPTVSYSHKTAEYLTHLVSRTPVDLISHTQRICLYRELENADATYGALLDLFISLGENGQALRRRLLQQAAHIISQEHYEILFLALKNKIVASDHVPVSHHAVLSSGMAGKPLLLQHHQNPKTLPEEDPAQLAADLLNSGQILRAQDILEQALLATPWRSDLSEELLQIYRHTNNRDDCILMLQQLKSTSFTAQGEWAELILTLDQCHHEENISTQ